MTHLLPVVIFLLWTGTTYAAINFIALGDWGPNPYPDVHGDEDDEPGPTYGTDDQKRVADRMDQYCSENVCDHILTLGDNFYPNGVTALNDTRWDDVWRNVYNHTNLRDLHWWTSMGNHDHMSDLRGMYQVDYTLIEPRWHQPYLFYDTYWVKDDITIHVIVLDSENLQWDFFDNKDEQLAFVNDTLRNAQPSDYTFFVAHHPMRSCGRYAPGNNVLNRDVLPMISPDYDDVVDLWMAGHDHNMQHIVRNDSVGMDFVVSGAGGRGRYEQTLIFCREMHEDGFTLNYFGERYGFTGVVVEKDQLTVTHYGDVLIDGQLEVLYSFSRPSAKKRREMMQYEE